VCLLAASLVQLSVSAGNGWPHNALRHYWLMPISCHFRDCKAPLVTGVTHVSGGGAIASVQTFTFTNRGRQFWMIFFLGGEKGNRGWPLLFVQAINEGQYPVIVKSHTKLGTCELRIQPIPASDLKIAYTIMTLSLSPIIITTSRSSIYKNLRLPPLFSPFTYEPHFTMQRHKIQFAGSIVKLHKYYQQMQRLVARHFQGVDSRSE